MCCTLVSNLGSTRESRFEIRHVSPAKSTEHAGMQTRCRKSKLALELAGMPAWAACRDVGLKFETKA